MSGGVDSSVTARLLAEQVRLSSPDPTTNISHHHVSQDYNLSAIFMRNWDTYDESGTDKGCEWEKDWEDVRRVCSLLGIPCEMVSGFGYQ